MLGYWVVSGLAQGIDAAAHEGALASAAGTIAVVGTGLDRVYPPQHRALADRIALRGALLSEYAPGTPALPEHFPQRNRIIAGPDAGHAGGRGGAALGFADHRAAGQRMPAARSSPFRARSTRRRPRAAMR